MRCIDKIDVSGQTRFRQRRKLNSSPEKMREDFLLPLVKVQIITMTYRVLGVQMIRNGTWTEMLIQNVDLGRIFWIYSFEFVLICIEHLMTRQVEILTIDNYKDPDDNFFARWTFISYVETWEQCIDMTLKLIIRSKTKWQRIPNTLYYSEDKRQKYGSAVLPFKHQ